MSTIADLGEFGLIAAIAERLTRTAPVIVGVGDDAAVLRAPDGRVVATTDMLIEGRHFRRDWSAAADIGHKAAARNLADIAAMGARPTGLLLGFAGPGDTEVSWVIELVDGIVRECAAVGASVAGGDTSSADTIMLAITALGDLGGSEPLTRAGARPGDVVAVTGTLGSAAAGLALLAAGWEPAVAGADREDGGDGRLARLVAAHRRPAPPYDAGPQAVALGATSMIDVSDGLMADLGHVADASGVRLDVLSRALLAEPVAWVGALQAAAVAARERNWRDWVLTGGDDHAMAATFPRETGLPGSWTIIGKVTRGSGVAVDGRAWNSAGGWEHFRE